jgi:uncharacterized membrane protein
MLVWVTLASLAATLFMTGLNWFVQLVHYPLMAKVGREGFAAYETAHMRLTTLVVGPAMLVEAVATVALLLLRRDWMTVTSAALLGVVWLSTALLQIPAHETLVSGYDEPVIRRLVETNWLRTAAWSLRSAILVCFAARNLRPGA